jgi:UrcA family protein
MRTAVMHSNSSDSRAFAALAFAAAALATTYSAAAQQKQNEVVVEAQQPGRSAVGAIDQVSVQRLVSYADISLTTPSGRAVLETRIHDAARSACGELDQKYPFPIAGDAQVTCFNKAVDDAMVDARQAMAAADQKSPGAYAAAAVPAIQAPEEVTVEAVRGSARSPIGAELKEVSAKRTVSYRDISLTTQSGVTVLENRIREAATSACTELEQKFPVPAPGESSSKCIGDAVQRAMADAGKAIDSARVAADLN